jgi:hypothetical protein
MNFDTYRAEGLEIFFVTYPYVLYMKDVDILYFACM